MGGDGARKTVRSVLLFFRSSRVAILLIVGFTAACFAGVLVPQETTSGRAAVEAFQRAYPSLKPLLLASGAHRIFQTPWFLALVGLLVLSTLICTLDQLARARRSASFARSRQPVVPGANATEIMLDGPPESAAPRIEDLLRRLGLKVWRSGTEFRAWNTTGRWGSPLFHLGLVLFFATVVVGAAVQWTTTLVLSEGQTFAPGQGPPHGVNPTWTGATPDPARLPQLKLVKHYPRYARKGYSPDAASEVIVDGQPQLLRWGAPLPVRGLTLRQSRRYGALADVVLTPASGPPAVARKSPGSEPDGPPAFGGLFPLPDGSYRGGLVFVNQADAEKQVRAALLPPLQMTASFRLVPGPEAASYDLPFARRFQLEVIAPPASIASRPVVLSAGERLTLGNWQLEFRSLRYWTTLTLSSAPLTPVLFALGWWCAVMLALGVLWPERRVELVLEGVAVGGADKSRVRLQTWVGRGAFAFPGRLRTELEGLNEKGADRA